MTEESAPRWDRKNLADLFDLEALEAQPPEFWRFRSRVNQSNENSRVYGGQLLAQSLLAAARTTPGDRAPSSMQLMFTRGASPDRPVDYAVTALQDGKRFCARNVRGSQGGFICDAQIAFALALESPAHMSAPPPDPRLSLDPATLPGMSELSRRQGADSAKTLGYRLKEIPTLDFRFPDLVSDAPPGGSDPRFRFWGKARQILPDDAAQQAAAFAYLSDWWLNFVCCADHVPALAAAGQRLYVASLNHSIWFHRPMRADDWLLFDCVSPSAAAGRGLAIARVHDRSGALVASVTQEALMTPYD